MNSPPNGSNPHPGPGRFFGDGCVNVVIDVEGDTTVRPCPPELLPLLTAEREKARQLQEWLKQQAENAKQPPQDPTPPQGPTS